MLAHRQRGNYATFFKTHSDGSQQQYEFYQLGGMPSFTPFQPAYLLPRTFKLFHASLVNSAQKKIYVSWQERAIFKEP